MDLAESAVCHRAEIHTALAKSSSYLIFALAVDEAFSSSHQLLPMWPMLIKTQNTMSSGPAAGSALYMGKSMAHHPRMSSMPFINQTP